MEKNIYLTLLFGAGLGLAVALSYYAEAMRSGYYLHDGYIICRQWFAKRKIDISTISEICICSGYRSMRGGPVKVKKWVRINGVFRKIECPWIMILPKGMNYAINETTNWSIKQCIGEEPIYGFVLLDIERLKYIEKYYQGKYCIPLDYYIKYEDYLHILMHECGIEPSRIKLLQVLE